MPEQGFLGSGSLKVKWFTILDGDLKMAFNLLYGKVLSIELCRRFLFLMAFYGGMGKNKLIPFLAQHKQEVGDNVSVCVLNLLP